MSSEPLHRLVAAYIRSRAGERLTAEVIAGGLLEANPGRFAEKEKSLVGRRSVSARLLREIYAQKPHC